MNHKGEGTAILVHNEIISKKQLDIVKFVETEIESTFIEIKAKNGKQMVVGSMYRPPNSKENKFTQELTKIINKVKSENKELICGMDNNMDLLKSSEHSMTQKFIDNSLGNDMLPTITRPMRITHSTATLIDNVFVSNQLYMSHQIKHLCQTKHLFHGC